MDDQKIAVLNSKLNLPIIQIEYNGHMIPIHSKYNPVAEAERLINSYAEQIEQADHIFFYGVGLGYHVKIAQQRYPGKMISTYEPFENVHKAFAENAKKIGINVVDIVKQFVEYTEEDILKSLTQFKPYLAQRIVILIHPVYEKIAQASFKQFSEIFQQFIQDTRFNTQTKLVFNDRWVINMIMNAHWTLNTPNILTQSNNPFKGKPIVLVAAGPSLSEEIDNLRYIKEHGLAYIFAVGSANEVLIKQCIYPDAVLSYDPGDDNYTVFIELVKQNITDIPIIFGTTVGHETVPMFPGPKIHMVMNRDKLSPYLHCVNFDTINDSGTISNVTLQLIEKLNVSQVILVGQNFAYKKDAFYAKGIKTYDDKRYIDSILQKIELGETFYVEDVHGGQVQTDQAFNQMRREMEYYIQQMSNLKIVNTTQGGAKIEGTVFQSLKEMIDTGLTDKVVLTKWWEQLEQPTKIVNTKLVDKMKKASEEYRVLYNDMMNILERLEKKNDSSNGKQINQMLDKMYKLLAKLTKNKLFELIFSPIMSVHTERIYSNLTLCQRMDDNSEKIKKVVKIYREYMLITLDIYRSINPIIQLQLLPQMENKEQWKYYEAICGVVHYEGDWRKKSFLRKEPKGEIASYGASAETTRPGAIFHFKFTGTALQLLGTNAVKSALKLKITIDRQDKIVSVFDYSDEKFSTFHQKILFETSKLTEGMHEVTIEIISNEVHFNLLGIRVHKEGRLYHINEVEKIEDLTVGKYIRCHYESSFNTQGAFTRFGEACGEYLPSSAISNPNGDFYFIMVNDVNGEKVLIADRVLQNRMSKDAIMNKEIIVNNKKANISLLTSSVDFKKSEWDQYLASNPNIRNNNLQWHADSFSACWVDNIDSEDQVLLRGSYIGEDGSINMDDGFEYSTTGVSFETLKMNGYRPKLVISNI